MTDIQASAESSTEDVVNHLPGSVLLDANKQLTLFSNFNTRLYQTTMDVHGAWTPWVDLGGPVHFKTPTAVLSTVNPPTLAVMDGDGDGRLIYKTHDQSWGEWRDAGVTVAGTGIAAIPSHALAMVFGIGAEGTVRTAWMLPALSSAPGGLQSWPWFQVLPDPVAIADSKTVEVFVRRKDDRAVWNLTRIWNESAWIDWRSLGGVLTSSLAVARSNGALRIFARGEDGALLWKYQTNSGARDSWGPWTSLGGKITSAPAVYVDAGGLDHVFARGASGVLEYTSRSSTISTWTPLAPLVPDDSVSLSSAPMVFQYPDHAAVFVLGSDGSIWWLLFGPSGLKMTWQKIPPPGR